MGEVYRARDTKLKRDVAIKVLPQSLSADPDALARFEREALAVAALSHPNILAIHDFGREDGVAYAVMELLEGETLRDKLDASPIPQKRAVDYALQVANGLSAAHEKGIVHRDLKPENLFVTKDGNLKILDFGLAKRVAKIAPGEETKASTVSGHTAPGTVMGTVGYMSPEQVRGLPVDHRSDIFSFGAILYEMLSGKRAFSRPTVADTMSAIMKEEPPELSQSGGNISLGVDHIVRHCLEKDRDNRFQSVRDLAFDLSEQSSQPLTSSAQVAVPPTGKRKVLIAAAAITVLAVAGVLLLRPQKGVLEAGGVKRVAVLPFENLGSSDDAYFASGMTEEITSRLANVRSLAVISRTTATQYDRRGKTVEQIGKDLGVGYVLEGSVRWDRSGGGPGRVRITPQLIRVADDTPLWSERFDRQLADIFAIQGDVADGVVRALNITLAPAESKALRQLPTKDLEAYDLYLRALELRKRGQEPSAIVQQIKLTSQAVERDPQFAEALALLARVRILNYWLYYDRRESELERAKVEAELAVALRPDSAETHWALGFFHYQGRLDYEKALAEFNKALTIQPNNALVRVGIGAVRRRQGRTSEAEAEFRKAIDGDPRNGSTYFNLGQTQLLLRNYSDASRSLEMSTSLNPTNAVGHCWWALAIILWHGDVAAAEQVLKKAAEVPNLEETNGLVDYFSLRASLIARDWEGALRRLNSQRQEAAMDQHRYFPRSLLHAEVLSYMGRQRQARESHEEARRILVAKIDETPEDARLHSSLGITLAGLGRTAEAVQEGERGVELMPPTRDAFRGVSRVEDLAWIYTMVGNQEASIQQLDYLLSHPSCISSTLLKFDPRWDPLRKNPKFEALLVKYGVRP
jgi:serine/threonine protein kinase/tetratricopeptide (TPR) repeat protein